MSLLATATANARHEHEHEHEHEPKSLRGGDVDEHDLELETRQINHIIPQGKSASIQCGSGSQCCVTGNFKSFNNMGSMTRDSCQGFSFTNVSLSNCLSNTCFASCDGGCNVKVQAGGAGRGGSAGGRGRGGGAAGGKRGRSAAGPGHTRRVKRIIPQGRSAAFQCVSGSQCCVTGNFESLNNMGSMTNEGSCQGYSMTKGSLSNCLSNSCSVSCDGGCDVLEAERGGSAGIHVQARGRNDGGGKGGRSRVAIAANHPVALRAAAGRCLDEGNFSDTFKYATPADLQAHLHLRYLYMEGKGVEADARREIASRIQAAEQKLELNVHSWDRNEADRTVTKMRALGLLKQQLVTQFCG
eukprot:scaffold6345_cov107-Skeletonema_dohrnii-CCMP3373.AAC.1